MTLPVPGQPGETPEQRQARFAAADAVQARIDAERRAQLEAQANPVSRRLPEGVGIPMPTPQPPAGGLTQAAPFDVAAAYRQHSQKLADAIKAGQITVERARQLQAPLFAATKLGSTPEGQAAMNAAAAQAQGGMPMSGYDAAAQYRNFGQELMGMIKSGALTVEQANALKAPVFNAVKLGNSNAGYQQMQAALNAARQQMGGQNVGQSFNPVTSPPSPPRMPEIVTPPQVSQPQELPVTPTQPDMPERHSEYGIPLWMQLGAGPERDVAYAQYMKAQRGEMQPKFIGKNFTGDAPPPGKKYIETPEGLVPVPINDVPVKPAMGPGLGRALGMPMQGVGMAPQMPQGMTLSNVPRQLTLSNVPMQGAAPQPVSAPQGMAMGGLLRKYYGGGMC